MIGRITAPIRKVQASLRSLYSASGLPRIAAAAGDINTRFSRLTGTLRGLRTGFFYVAAVATAALYPMKRTIDDLSEVNDIAASFGISARELQRLTAALTLDGSSLRDAAMSLKFLQQNAVAALTGSEEMATWFRRAGISAEFLKKNLKDPKALLYAMADGLKKNETPAKRIAILNALLGKSSARVAQTLSRGSDEIKRQGDEAERLGQILDNKTVGAMDAAGDSILKMQRTVGGLMAVITAAALPVIQEITRGVIGWVQANRALIATRATQFFQELLVRLPAIWDGIKKTASAIYDIVSAVNSVVQVFGGWGNVAKIVAGILVAKLALAIASVTYGVIALGAVLLATPIGWFILGIAALAAGAVLLVKNWESVKTFFMDLLKTVLWPFVKVLEIVHRLMPERIRTGTAFGRGLGASLDWVNGRPTSSVFGTGGMPGGTTQVGGTINIKIDSEGRPQLTQLKSDNRSVVFDVDTGFATAGMP